MKVQVRKLQELVMAGFFYCLSQLPTTMEGRPLKELRGDRMQAEGAGTGTSDCF